MGAAPPKHLVRGIDADAVRRSAVGDPPRALVEPDLAMPPARVFAVDDDVGAFAATDDITPSRNYGRQRHMPLAVRVVDLHFECASGDRRALDFESASLFRRTGGALLRPAPLETHLIAMLARARLAAAQFRQQSTVRFIGVGVARCVESAEMR